MGLTLIGSIESGDLHHELKGVLFSNEQVISIYRSNKSLVVFTDLRLIIIDNQGKQGRKVIYKIIPYKAICRFTLEKSQTTDLDSEIKLYIGTTDKPTEVLKMENVSELDALQQLISHAIIKGNLIGMTL